MHDTTAIATPQNKPRTGKNAQAALGQLGAHTPEEARPVVIRHKGALQF